MDCGKITHGLSISARHALSFALNSQAGGKQRQSVLATSDL
jgi:hypothetical protein